MEHVTRAHLDREMRNGVETALRPQPHKEGSYICILCGREVPNRLSVRSAQECPLCPDGHSLPNKRSIVYHFGVVHNMVDHFLEPMLEPEHRIKAQKRGRSKTEDILESRKGALSHDSAEPLPASGSSSS
jgi:hypothetical protein